MGKEDQSLQSGQRSSSTQQQEAIAATKTPVMLNATWVQIPKLDYQLQTRRRQQRRRESYSTLLQHVSDESLKAVIRAEAGPNAANAADRLNGRTAWLTLERECQEPMSALHINTKIIEFNGLTMQKDVGINEQSIIEFSRICSIIEERRPACPKPLQRRCPD